jgi:hypothetical protein
MEALQEVVLGSQLLCGSTGSRILEQCCGKGYAIALCASFRSCAIGTSSWFIHSLSPAFSFSSAIQYCTEGQSQALVTISARGVLSLMSELPWHHKYCIPCPEPHNCPTPLCEWPSLPSSCLDVRDGLTTQCLSPYHV